MVKKLNREFILNTADIDRIDADGNYVIIHAQGQTWPLRESMAALERAIHPSTPAPSLFKMGPTLRANG